MINLFVSPTYRSQIKSASLANCVKNTLEHLGIKEEMEINIAIRNSNTVRLLNKQFRETDSPTDVLSFPADEMDPENGLRILGDIVISFPVARQQAEEAKIPVADEIQILVVHGLLHLLGYDHELEKDKEKMWAIQGTILQSLAIKTDGID